MKLLHNDGNEDSTSYHLHGTKYNLHFHHNCATRKVIVLTLVENTQMFLSPVTLPEKHHLSYFNVVQLCQQLAPTSLFTWKLVSFQPGFLARTLIRT